MNHHLSHPSKVDSGNEPTRVLVAKSSYWESVRPYTVVCLLLWLIIGGLLVLYNVNSTHDRIFLGLLGSGHHKWVVDDGALYLDMIEQAQNPGVWLFQNRFSPEIGPARYLNSVWVVVGKLSAPFGLSPLGAYTVFRFLAILVFLIALRTALREFLKNRAARSLALVLIVFGGGLGWIFGVAGHWSTTAGAFFIEGKKSEVWCFLATMIGPHNVLAMSLVIWIMAGLSMSSRGSRPAFWFVPLIAFGLATFHPYDLPVVYAVGGIFLVLLRLRDGKINRPLFQTYVAAIVCSMPILAYHWWALGTAPDLRGLLLQNNIVPYGSLRFLIGMLPLGLLAFRRLTTALADYHSAGNGQLLIISWAALLPVLLYSFPDIGFAWKLTIGMPLPICVLAVEWMEQRVERIRRSGRFSSRPFWRKSPAIACVVVVSLLSSAFIVCAMANSAREKTRPYYVSRGDYDALMWLGNQDGTDDTVLSSRFPGVFVPRFARKRAFMGHDNQSVDFWGKVEFAESLFTDGKLSDHELQALRRYRVKWLIYGENERKWWPAPNPSKFISLAYDRDGVRIYKLDYNAVARASADKPQVGSQSKQR